MSNDHTWPVLVDWLEAPTAMVNEKGQQSANYWGIAPIKLLGAQAHAPVPHPEHYAYDNACGDGHLSNSWAVVELAVMLHSIVLNYLLTYIAVADDDSDVENSSVSESETTSNDEDEDPAGISHYILTSSASKTAIDTANGTGMTFQLIICLIIL